MKSKSIQDWMVKGSTSVNDKTVLTFENKNNDSVYNDPQTVVLFNVLFVWVLNSTKQFSLLVTLYTGEERLDLWNLKIVNENMLLVFQPWHAHKRTHARTHTRIYIHVHTHAYTHTHIHTHTHTHTMKEWVRATLKRLKS